MQETILWTNTNIATSSTAIDFAGQTITLSDDVNNYDFIAIEFMQQNVLAQVNNVNRVYYRVSDFLLFQNVTRKPIGSLSFIHSAAAFRSFWHVSDTQMRFGNDSLANSLNVPKYVYGISI